MHDDSVAIGVGDVVALRVGEVTSLCGWRWSHTPRPFGQQVNPDRPRPVGREAQATGCLLNAFRVAFHGAGSAADARAHSR